MADGPALCSRSVDLRRKRQAVAKVRFKLRFSHPTLSVYSVTSGASLRVVDGILRMTIYDGFVETVDEHVYTQVVQMV